MEQNKCEEPGVLRFQHTLLDKATTPDEIFRIAGKKCNVFTYPELARFRNIKQLFKRGNSDIPKRTKVKVPFDGSCCIILYMSGPNFGHWCALTKRGTEINFLDSYGDLIDDQLEHVDKSIEGQDKKHLIKMLCNHTGDIYYNGIKLQKLSTHIATCGRYCALYLKYDYLNVDDFTKKLKKKAKEMGVTTDVLVCMISLDPHIQIA